MKIIEWADYNFNYKLQNVIDNLNIFLKEIIPDLTIKIKEYGEELDENGDPVIKIEMLAERGEIKIPLRYESDGIKLGGQNEEVYELSLIHIWRCRRRG